MSCVAVSQIMEKTKAYVPLLKGGFVLGGLGVLSFFAMIRPNNLTVRGSDAVCVVGSAFNGMLSRVQWRRPWRCVLESWVSC